jgi:CRP-like cAMP-binding protein
MHEAIGIYLDAVRAVCPKLSGAELGELAGRLTVSHRRRHEIYIQPGQVQEEAGFVVRGLVRSYYLDQDGTARTVRFYAERDYAVHYSAFIARQPSKYVFQCLEPVTMVGLPYSTMQWAYQTFPQFEQYGRLMAEEVLKAQQARIESFLFQTAEARYLGFIAQYPEVFRRISLSHLSSYLGIERQTLTRIRQKLARS